MAERGYYRGTGNTITLPPPPPTHRHNPSTPSTEDGEPVYDTVGPYGKNGSKRKSKQIYGGDAQTTVRVAFWCRDNVLASV